MLCAAERKIECTKKSPKCAGIHTCSVESHSEVGYLVLLSHKKGYEMFKTGTIDQNPCRPMRSDAELMKRCLHTRFFWCMNRTALRMHAQHIHAR